MREADRSCGADMPGGRSARAPAPAAMDRSPGEKAAGGSSAAPDADDCAQKSSSLLTGTEAAQGAIAGPCGRGSPEATVDDAFVPPLPPPRGARAVTTTELTAKVKWPFRASPDYRVKKPGTDRSGYAFSSSWWRSPLVAEFAGPASPSVPVRPARYFQPPTKRLREAHIVQSRAPKFFPALGPPRAGAGTTANRLRWQRRAVTINREPVPAGARQAARSRTECRAHTHVETPCRGTLARAMSEQSWPNAA